MLSIKTSPRLHHLPNLNPSPSPSPNRSPLHHPTTVFYSPVTPYLPSSASSASSQQQALICSVPWNRPGYGSRAAGAPCELRHLFEYLSGLTESLDHKYEHHHTLDIGQSYDCNNGVLPLSHRWEQGFSIVGIRVTYRIIFTLCTVLQTEHARENTPPLFYLTTRLFLTTERTT